MEGFDDVKSWLRHEKMEKEYRDLFTKKLFGFARPEARSAEGQLCRQFDHEFHVAKAQYPRLQGLEFDITLEHQPEFDAYRFVVSVKGKSTRWESRLPRMDDPKAMDRMIVDHAREAARKMGILIITDEPQLVEDDMKYVKWAVRWDENDNPSATWAAEDEDKEVPEGFIECTHGAFLNATFHIAATMEDDE